MTPPYLEILAGTLAAVVDGKWQPGIGDPSVFGWITVAAYLIAAVLCVRAAINDKKLIKAGPKDSAMIFWLAMAGVLLLLSVNKQLDLQTLLTEQMRIVARQRGWLAYGQQLKQWFIMIVGFVGIAMLVAMVWSTRRVFRRVWLAIIGATFLILFILVRTSSFHHVDHWLGLLAGLANRNVTLALGGICIIVLAALLSTPTSEADKETPG